MTGGDEVTGDHEDLAERGPGPRDVDLGRVWLGVAAEVWRRRPGPLERLAGRLLRSPGLARALVTTPSLLVGWITATAVVLVAGILATLGTGTPYVALVAPAVAAGGCGGGHVRLAGPDDRGLRAGPGGGDAGAVGECGRGGRPGRLGDHGAVRAGGRWGVHRRGGRFGPGGSLPGVRGRLRRDRLVCDPDPERNLMNVELSDLT